MRNAECPSRGKAPAAAFNMVSNKLAQSKSSHDDVKNGCGSLGYTRAFRMATTGTAVGNLSASVTTDVDEAC